MVPSIVLAMFNNRYSWVPPLVPSDAATRVSTNAGTHRRASLNPQSNRDGGSWPHRPLPPKLPAVALRE